MTALKTSRWTALPVVLAGTFLVVLDFFIVNVALPSMQTDLRRRRRRHRVGRRRLRADLRPCSDHRRPPRRPPRPPARLHGRRRPVHAELARLRARAERRRCSSPPARPGRRGRGDHAPGALDHRRHLPRRRPRPRAGVYGVALGLAAVGGQLIGGALVQVDLAGLGWRSCFLINVPIGLVALALAPRLVPESRAAGRRAPRRGGAALLDARPHRDPAAAHRGPRARLAGVDVDLARRRAADPRRLPRAGRCASAPAVDAAAGPRCSAGGLHRRPGHRSSGAGRRPSSCCSRSTCSPAAASGRCRPAWCSRSSPSPFTWPACRASSPRPCWRYRASTRKNDACRTRTPSCTTRPRLNARPPGTAKRAGDGVRPRSARRTLPAGRKRPREDQRRGGEPRSAHAPATVCAALRRAAARRRSGPPSRAPCRARRGARRPARATRAPAAGRRERSETEAGTLMRNTLRQARPARSTCTSTPPMSWPPTAAEAQDQAVSSPARGRGQHPCTSRR